MEQQTTVNEAEATPVAPRLTMRRILGELVERFFDVDKGWLRTARELILVPGAMIGRYVSGPREVYANPFTYLVVGTAVNIMVQKVVGFQEKMVSTARSNSLESPLQMEFVDRFTELMSQNALFMSIGIVLPLALFLRLFFRHSGYNLAEYCVFALYASGHLALLGLVLVPAYMLLPPSAAIQGVVGITVAIIYTVYAARGFFSGGLVAVAAKTALAYVMAYSVFMVVMMVIVIAYVFAVLVPTSSGVEWDLVTATDYEVIPVVDKLLDEGADVNRTLGRTALHAAAANGNLEIVETLIEHGADANLQDIHGRVPMFVALAEHHPEVARRLAEETDPDVRTVDGSTLLIEAARAEDVILVQWALDHGTDPNAVRPGKNNATALILAARNGNLEIVKLLLAQGADPAVTNDKGKTAIDLAKGKNVKELLRTSAQSLTPTEP